MKIINSTILNNEVWALELRLAEEYKYYDKVIITESKQTFSGKEKILYFKKYANRFRQYFDKIEYLIIDELPKVEKKRYIGYGDRLATENRWPLEWYQRTYCKKFIVDMGLAAEDIVVMQDVDEIFPPDHIPPLFNKIDGSVCIALEYHDYRNGIYKENLKAELFRGGYACTYDIFKNNDIHDIRRCTVRKDTVVAWHIANPQTVKNLDGTSMYDRYDLNFPLLYSSKLAANPGWHLSDMTGGYDKVLADKCSSFSHSELSPGSSHNISVDMCQELENHFENIEQKVEIGKVDNNLPGFIRNRLNDFPILWLNR